MPSKRLGGGGGQWTAASLLHEDEDAPPIETDPQLFLETVERLAKKALLSDVLLWCCRCWKPGCWLGPSSPLPSGSWPPLTALCHWHLLAVHPGGHFADVVLLLAVAPEGQGRRCRGEFTPVRSHRRFRVTLALAAVGVSISSSPPACPDTDCCFWAYSWPCAPFSLSPPSPSDSKAAACPSQGQQAVHPSLQCGHFPAGDGAAHCAALLPGWNPAFHLEAEDLEAPLTMADLTAPMMRGMSSGPSGPVRLCSGLHLHRGSSFDRDADLPEISYEIVDVWFHPSTICAAMPSSIRATATATFRGTRSGACLAVYKDAEGYPPTSLLDKRLVRLSATFP